MSTGPLDLFFYFTTNKLLRSVKRTLGDILHRDIECTNHNVTFQASNRESFISRLVIESRVLLIHSFIAHVVTNNYRCCNLFDREAFEIRFVKLTNVWAPCMKTQMVWENQT